MILKNFKSLKKVSANQLIVYNRILKIGAKHLNNKLISICE
jgi:hypothetical protein